MQTLLLLLLLLAFQCQFSLCDLLPKASVNDLNYFENLKEFDHLRKKCFEKGPVLRFQD